MSYIVLLRHAKAIKNTQKLHGGNGTSIIQDEIKTINNCSQKFILFEINFDKIFYSPRLQCKETAELIGQSLKIPVVANTSILPINLGIIDGLSESAISEQFPDIYWQFKQWQSGSIEINELKIPGMEDCQDYFLRGKVILDQIRATGENVILLCTRSSLVLYSNILLGNDPSPGGGYKEILWDNCEYLTFKFEYSGNEIIKEYSSGQLLREIYKDHEFVNNR